MTPIVAYVGSFWQWVILFAIILVVFGAKRLPDVARNLGKSLAAFQKARREFEEELMKGETASKAAEKPHEPAKEGGKEGEGDKEGKA